MRHGTFETIDGRPAVRFERDLRHPVDAVWAAVTGRDLRWPAASYQVLSSCKQQTLGTSLNGQEETGD